MDASTESLVEPEITYHSNGMSGSLRQFRGIALEFAVLLLFFAVDLSGTIIQYQIIYQTCTQVFEYNVTDCLLLGTEEAKNQTANIETEIQPYVAKIFMTRSIIDGVVPFIGALYLGGWSDRYGRKPVILLSFSGYTSMYVLCAALAYASTIYRINPWYYIVMMLPKAIVSAEASLKSAAFAYITDVTDDNSRMLRMSIYEAFMYVGIVGGFLSSSAVFHATNAYSVFGISAGLIFVALLLVFLALNESARTNELDDSRSLSFMELLKWPVMRRDRYDRALLWLIISALTLNIFVVGGAANVFYLFVREKFDWSIQQYTQYEALQITIQIIGNTVLICFLQKICKLSAVSITLLAYGGYVIDATIKGTSQFAWELYMAAATGILSATPGPMCRSIMSTFIPSTEIGKVYSFVSALQSVTPLASAPFYTELYTRTLKYDSGVFNLFSAGFYVICFILTSIVFGILKSYKRRGTRDFRAE